MATMENRKTILMFVLMLVGLTFIYIGFFVSLLGFLATIGAWTLLGLLYYDYHRTQKKYEEKYSQH